MLTRRGKRPITITGGLLLLALLSITGAQCLCADISPTRVVSINLCTDQLLVMLADPSQITSLSYLSRDPHSSFIAEQAQGYPVNHARLEELLQLQPDLILAGAYSDPRLLRLLKQLGLRVVQFPLTHSIAGIKQDVRRMAALLHRSVQGIQLIEQMESRLARIAANKTRNTPAKALFYQPRGYTSGANTLQDEALRVAGWHNVAAELGIEGYAPIDLETLLLAKPTQLFSSNHNSASRSLAQQQLRHPALEHLLQQHPLKEVPYKYWICAGPMIVDAIDALQASE